MMNEEKRDRMIRESLDKYLSGIDALPSQRAAISKSLVDRPPFFRRAAFRAVAVPAALTLLLCAGIGVFAGLQNHTAYPDHVKTDETLVAVQPEPTDFIALAAPEGEEGGADTVVIGADGVTWDQWGAVVPTVEPAPEVTVRLAEFISLWREQRWADILKICTPDWTSQYENPEARLAELASFVTPGAYEIESVTEIGEVFVGGYSIDFTVRDQDNPDALYRVNLSLKKESDSRLYAYPETLDYYKVMAPQELIEATEAERLNRAITADSPELAAALAPVNTACEEAGIRLEIISAAMNRDKAIIVYSLQDLEGMQVSMDSIEDYPSIHFDWISNYASTSYPLYTYWDEAQDKFTCARAFLFDNPIDQVNLSGRVFMEMCNMTTAQLKETDLIPLLRQYGNMAGNLTELPLNTYVSGFAQDNEYTEAELRELGFKVLDPSKALDVQLGDYVTLTAIGVKDDGLLHLQLRYPDNCGWWFPQFISASGVPLAEDSSGSVPCTYVDWSGSQHNAGCWLEAQFSLEGEIADNASLIVGIYEIPEIKLGEWKTEFTVGQVIALAAPEGEEGETDTVVIGEDGVAWDQWGAVVPTVEPEPYASVRLVKFFSHWRDHNWQGMLSLCASAWTEQAENPEKALEGLASFATPDSFEIVSAVSIPGSEGPEYTMYCTLRTRDAGYRTAIRMAKGRDGLWYVFPDSLKEYETVPVEETLAGRRKKNPVNRDLMYISYDLYDKLVPLNLVCESSGIRLEIISAAMDDNEALILFSVQDLEEGRAELSMGTVIPPTVTLKNGCDEHWTSTLWYMDGDAEPNKVIIGEHLVYDKALNPAELSDRFTLSMESVALTKGLQLDLVSLLQQYGEQTGDPVDPPMPASVCSMSHIYTSDELRDQRVKVLDPSRSLEVQLSDNIYMSGIKLDEDRLLHLQLRFMNQLVWYPQLVNSTNISWNDFINPEETRCLTWSGTDDEGEWLEYRLRLDSDLAEDSSLIVSLNDNVGFVTGDWSVEIPAAQIWAGKEIAAGNDEAPAAGTEENREDKEAADMVPTIEMYTASFLKENPKLAAALVPVNMAWESDGFRLEIVSAALSEQDALVVYTVEDTQKTGLLADPDLEFPALFFLREKAPAASYPRYCGLDMEENKITTLMLCRFTDPIDPAELPDRLPMYIRRLCTTQRREVDLIPLLKQYGSLAGELTELPDSASASICTSDRTYFDSKFSDMGIKVLDPSKAMDVPLGDNINLAGIALKEDGILHLQLRYPDIGSWWNPDFALASGVPLTGGTYGSDLSSFVFWTGSDDNPGCWLEMQFHLDGEIRDDAELIVEYTDMPKLVGGTWQVDVPTGQIWVDPQNIPEAAPETPDPAGEAAEGTAETAVRDEPYANVRLVKFFRLWREQDWQGMLDMCTSGWKAQAEDPLKALESIAWIRGLEIVSMNPLPAAEPEYIMECIVRSKPDPDAWYRLNVALEKEADGLWYVNPESLRKTGTLSEEEIALRRSSSTGRTWYFAPDTTSSSSSDSGDSMGFLRSKNSRLVDDLVPVGLSCESDGIRLEIISAAIEEEGSLILYSLKDLTGDRVGRHKEYNPWLHVSEVVDYADGWTLSFLEQNAAAHYASYGLYIPGNSLYCAQGNLTFYLENDLLFYRSKETDLISYLRKYEDRNWALADLPENATLYPNIPEFETPAEGLGIKVLDSTDPLGIPLAENVTLEGIGYADDGMLHIQMHVVNNDLLTDSSGYEYRPIFSVNTWRPYADYSIPEESSLTSWIVGEDRSEIWVEYAYRYSRESIDKDGLKAGVYTADGYAHGPWEIEIQTDSVRK